MYCPGGNATEPISRVLASSLGISSWTPLKPQHSNPNPNPLANQLWCIDFLTPPTPLIILHRLPAFFEYLNWCSIHARWSKSSLKHSIRLSGIFSKLIDKGQSRNGMLYYLSFKLNDPVRRYQSVSVSVWRQIRIHIVKKERPSYGLLMARWCFHFSSYMSPDSTKRLTSSV